MTDWKKIQETTFTKWVNSSLHRGHLTSTDRVSDLTIDLQDGIMLAELLENLAKSKLKYATESKHLKIKPQQLENLGISFRFMQQEKIKLVNIGPGDIYNGNLKLILGLIWTLIRRYQIRSTGRGLSTKDAMLAWVNTQIPDQNIRNFTTNWNSGVALCALVNRIQPGLIPQYATLSKSDGLKNCTLGIGLADEKLKIPKILEADELCHSDVDEISVMTYISFFCSPANSHLLKWVQAIIPARNINNFSTDWNNGVNLAYLLEALNRGGFPDCGGLNPQEAVDNLARAMKLAEEQLGIKPVLKPAQMADPSVDELNIVTYLSRFQNAKPLPQPQAVLCSGDGLTTAVVGKAALFEVDTTSGGTGDLEVEIKCDGKPLTASIDPKPGKKGVFTVKYTPQSGGKILISIKWSKAEIPTSPYSVVVTDVSQCRAYGDGLTSGKGKIKEPFEFTVSTKGAGNGELKVIPKGPKSVHSPSITKNPDDTYNVSFTTSEVGNHSIQITWSGMAIPKSPYTVKFSKSAASTSFTATGDGLKSTVALTPAEFMIVGPEAGLISSDILRIAISGNNLKSSMVSKADFKPESGKTIVLASDNGNGSYGVKYAVPIAGKFSISITSDGDHIPGSPFSAVALPAPDAGQCKAYGPAIDNASSLVTEKPLEFKVDSSNAGTGKLTVTAIDPKSASVPVFLAEDKTSADKKVHSVKIDPKTGGKYTVTVQWSGKNIPKSPFVFDVSNPKEVIIIDLPDSSKYDGHRGEVFSFSVDTRKAGAGELKGAAKLDNGKVETFSQTKNRDGTIKLSYTPTRSGKLELLLTFCEIDLLRLPWITEITDPTAFKVIPPKDNGKKAEYVKFVISGVTKKESKNVAISAKNKSHNATCKMEISEDNQAVGRFTAKEIGEYTVEVKVGKKHVIGSPFKVLVVNPDGCSVRGDIPTMVPIGIEKKFTVDTSSAGPGELTVECASEDGTPSECLQTDISSGTKKEVKFRGKQCGLTSVSLMFGGYALPSMPVSVAVPDPSKCTFTCKELESGSCKTNESITVDIDTTIGGSFAPELVAKGPKSNYEIELKKISAGKYTSTLTPWQEGENSLKVTVGGIDIAGSPKKFRSQKPLDTDKVTVSGTGLKGAITNRRAEVTVYARESMLVDKGILKIGFDEDPECDMEIHDKQNGTYSVAFTPHTTSDLKLSIKGDGKAIAGSPFMIKVLPEPDASKCTVKNRSGEEIFSSASFVYHLAKTPFELSVFTAGAGTGTLTATGKAPNKSQLPVYTNDQKVDGESVTSIKFDPTSVGLYTLSITWDKQELSGSPYKIKVIDPTKCSSSEPFPSTVQVGEEISYKIDTNGAGEGEIEAFTKGPEVLAKVTNGRAGINNVTVTGVQLGTTSVDIKFGGFSLPGAPYALTVCDPSKCTIDYKPGEFNLNMPIKFTVNANSAGRAKLQVLPSKKGSAVIRNPKDSTWEVTFTPKEIGTQFLKIIFGDWEVPGSPINFTVCDPVKVGVSGLPNPNDIILMGKPVNFSLDTSKSGPGNVVCHVIEDGERKDVSREETDADSDVMSMQFSPTKPGRIELILEFNGTNLLLRPHVYEVPDPSKFKVVLPHGYGRVNKETKFSVTGVGSGTKLSITAKHLGDSVQVSTERGADQNMVIARMTPEQIGEYVVEVKHADKHIDGSPFATLVCDPESCKFLGEIPSMIQVGVEPSIQIDTYDGGPGEVTFETAILSGAEQDDLSTEDKSHWILALKGVGKIRVTAKWAGYNIPGSPFTLMIVDSEKVKWSCDALDGKDTLRQGETIKIFVDGSEAGEASPQVIAVGPDEEYAAKIQDNEDGTFHILLNPWQIGSNEIKILWGGRPIPNTPVSFDVLKSIETRAITVSGEGLSRVIAKTEAILMINAIESGLLKRGLLKVRFESNEEEELPTFDVTDEGNGMYKLLFLALNQTTYSLFITYDDQDVMGSPFSISVRPAPDPSKCKSFGAAFESALFIVNDPVKFSVDTGEAGSGEISVSAIQPNGEPIRVYSVEEKSLHHLKFDPVLIGHYKVSVKWDSVDITGSPFDFNVVDPRKCVVEGLPSKNSHVQINEPVNFTVQMSEAGDCTPDVNATIDKTTTNLQPSVASNGMFSYTYIPKKFGKASIEVNVAGVHVPKSPASFAIIDQNELSISNLNLKGGYAIVCELINIEITGKTSDEDLFVTAHGPSADLNVDTVQKEDDVSIASFVPIEPGSYEIFVEYAGRHVNGSPVSIKVADPSKCQILGRVLSTLQVSKTNEITVKTRGAGEGKLEAFVRHENESSPALECQVKDLGLDTYSVALTGKEIGYSTIDLRWAGFAIPNSPFKVNVFDASKCQVLGDVLTSKKGKSGTPISFIVETAGAGDVELEVTAKGPSAQYTMNIEEVEESKYQVSFTPWEIGDHRILVEWGKMHVPESPLMVYVTSPLEMEICNATGSGLKHGIAGVKANFTIICSEIGLIDKNVLKVTVMGVTAHADVTLTDNNNGSYSVEYIPLTPGAYIASISFHDRQIPGSPFKIKVDSSPDASKCKAYGPALHPNTLAIAGSPLEFFVDTTAAGYGQLKVYIQGPDDYRPQVFMADDDKGIYSIKFDAMKAGKYFIVAVWSDKHIPNSPFRIRVHPAANAGKVKAYGPGLLDGFIGTPGQFTIDTKNAGIGTLLVRIHGLKDSFKIEAKPLSQEDPRTLMVTYSPRLIGEYTIFIRWSGVHAPGSAFTINIKQKPGTHDPTAEPQLRPRKKMVTPEKRESIEQQRHSTASQPVTPQRKISATKGGVVKRSPSGGAIAVNPIPPGMKLRDNPAMAMTLAQSLPPGYHQGYIAPMESSIEQTQMQKQVVQKKVVKKVVRKKHRSSSRGEGRGPGRAVSPRRDDVTSSSRRGRATSPEARKTSVKQATSPVRKSSAQASTDRRAASPSGKATSPVRRVVSSERQVVSSDRKAVSPDRKAVSPDRKAVSPDRKAVSPDRKAAPPDRRATAVAQKAPSPTRKATSPDRRAAQKATSPARKAAPKGGAKKKVVKSGSRAKSPPPKNPLHKGKAPPAKKSAKKRF